jgi:hypothetical protein
MCANTAQKKKEEPTAEGIWNFVQTEAQKVLATRNGITSLVGSSPVPHRLSSFEVTPSAVRQAMSLSSILDSLAGGDSKVKLKDWLKSR